MNTVLKNHKLALKLQLVSWFLFNENIGQHVTQINRLVDCTDEAIVINTYELSAFYRERYIDKNPDKFADGLVKFIEPKLSRLIYDLEEPILFFNLTVVHQKIAIKKNIILKTEL